MRLDEQNRLLISYEELVPRVFLKGTYDWARNQGGLVTTCRGGRGREVEIVYDECKPSYQAKIREVLGDPYKLVGINQDAEPVLSLNDLTTKELETCKARYEIVMQYRKYAELNKGMAKGLTNAKKQFVDLVIGGVWCAEAYKVVGKLSFQTIERWDKKLRDSNDLMSALVPERKTSNMDAAGLTDEQKKLLIDLYCTPNQPALADSLRLAASIWTAKGEVIPSEAKCRRFMTEWLKENEALAVFKRRGMKAMKDGFLPYLERDPGSIQFMDVLVSDGHVMNFQIDYTVAGADGREVHKIGRPSLLAWQDMRTGLIMGFELMMTENTMSVASSFRIACMNAATLCGSADCAILPRVVYMDNGKAFKNKFFNQAVDLKNSVGGLFEQLKAYGLESVQYALPYNARSKVIERAWRNFLELEKQAVSYTGDCIDNKPARMMRNEVLHREAYNEDLNAHGMLTLQGAYRMLERWITEYNGRISNGKYLQGKSPLQLAGEQIPEIDFSQRMLQASGLNYMIMQNRTCLIQRNGVKVNGNWYYNAKEFVLLPKGEIDVIVKYDMFHPERVYMFRTDGSYWCEAGFYRGNNVHAMARLGSDVDKRKYREAMQENRRIEHAVTVMSRAVGNSTELNLLIGERDVLPEPKPAELPPSSAENDEEIRLF